MLKTTNLFLPHQSVPKTDSFAILFAGIAFKISDCILGVTKPEPCFYAAYDKDGLYIYSHRPYWSDTSDSFFSSRGYCEEVAAPNTVPDACLDTFFGEGVHPSQFVVCYPLHLNFAFHSEDIDAMIDAIAPQSTTANTGDQS